MRLPQTPIGAMALCLTLFLTGCTKTVVQRQTPPAMLLAHCPEPAPPSLRTNGALAQSVLDYQTALDRCNDDKAALRAWGQ